MPKTASPKTKHPESQALQTPRRLKLPSYKRGRFQKRVKHPGPKLPSGWQIFKKSTDTIWHNKKLFGSITLVYGLLSLLFVHGFNNLGQLTTAKANLIALHNPTFNTATTLLTNLFSSSTNGTQASAVYQTFLFLIISLAIICGLRYTYGKNPKKAPIKAVFYKGMYPLIPFLLMILIIAVQLIPLLFAVFIYSTILSNGLAVTTWEQWLWGFAFFVVVVESMYIITSSLIALYVVTLPDVTPMQAWRSARGLVMFRRWTVMRKVLFMPFILFVLSCAIMLPSVLWLTMAAEWIFFVLGLLVLLFAHSYLYTLYRELM